MIYWPLVVGPLAESKYITAVKKQRVPFTDLGKQPFNYPELNARQPLYKDILFSCWNSAIEAFVGPIDLVANRRGAGGTFSQTLEAGGRLGPAMTPTFASASSQWAAARLDLSPFSAITISTWYRWETAADAGMILAEYSSNPNTAGVNAFTIQPSRSSGLAGLFAIYLTRNGSSQTAGSGFTRPSVSVWHHLVFVIDRTLDNGNFLSRGCFVDGLVPANLQSDAGTTGIGTDSTFTGPDTIYFFSRGGSSLFADGRIAYFNIFRRRLNAGEMLWLYRQPRLMLRYPESAGYR